MYRFWLINFDKGTTQCKMLIIGVTGCGVYGTLTIFTFFDKFKSILKLVYFLKVNSLLNAKGEHAKSHQHCLEIWAFPEEHK